MGVSFGSKHLLALQIDNGVSQVAELRVHNKSVTVLKSFSVLTPMGTVEEDGTLVADASFAARVAIASVLLNRFRSELFPASPVKIAKNAEFLSLDLSVTPSHKSLSAVRFALLGASPCGRALHAKKAEKGEGDNPILSVDGWLFYD